MQKFATLGGHPQHRMAWKESFCSVEKCTHDTAMMVQKIVTISIRTNEYKYAWCPKQTKSVIFHPTAKLVAHMKFVHGGSCIGGDKKVV
jgi:hypothetical protein